MKNFVEINFLEIEEKTEYVNIIKKVIEQAFLEEEIDKINLYINIILTNPENIRKINNKYRKIDKETDVLSFPMFEKQEIKERMKENNPIEDVLGDVVISVQRVKEQAEEYGHSFERELAYMLIHGFYHLMGYDHIEEKDKMEMRIKRRSKKS